ncbi:MAG: metallophosphoesterase [SAR324 cluster bacterium]|nr:metallophosphoesterase [SAR324 cluster bacterium]
MKILVISDRVSESLYENFDRDLYRDVEMVISCGDLPCYYLNFLIDALNVPCFYVPGNHDTEIATNPPAGWVCLHNRIIKHKNLTMVGIGGSPFYNGESPYQYTESQIFKESLLLSFKLGFKSKIDIFVTHSPALGMGDIKGSRVHQGFKTFVKFLNRHQPSLFLYGHTHLYYGVPRIGLYRDTLAVNGFLNYQLDSTNLTKLKKEAGKANLYTSPPKS